MSDLISVIVPVYNTGEYLERCVKSIARQDYENIEIILIDDGSTDADTITLCDILASNMSNVIVYHKPNGGSASARNYGIRHANGKYIGFVDSDDYIDAKMYSCLYSAIVRDRVRVSVCGLATHRGERIVNIDGNIRSGVYQAHEMMHHFLLGHWHSACTNLYERSLFGETFFPENEVNEDYMLNYRIFSGLETISVCSKPYYHYILREGSNTSSPKTLRFMDWIVHTSTILEELKTRPDLKSESEYQYLYSNIVLANSALLTLRRVDSDEAEKLYAIVTENLKKSKRMLLRNRYFSLRYYLMGMAMSYMPSLYKRTVLSVLKRKG